MIRFFTLYTKDTEYETEARGAIEAFKRFDLEITGVPYVNVKNWARNLLKRSQMLWDFAQQYPGDAIGLIDSDIRPMKKPQKLFDFDADFGCDDRGIGAPRNLRYCCGLMIFGASPNGRDLLSGWKERCQKDAEPEVGIREQAYLFDEVERLRAKPDFKFVNFGNAYNRKPEQVKPNDDTVMIHYMASRRLLNKIGGKR